MRAFVGAVLVFASLSLVGCPSSHGTGDTGSLSPDGSVDAAASPSDAGTDAALAPRDAGPADANIAEPCTMPGMVEMQSCGRCGTLNRFCGTDLAWSYGPCMGETGTCEPGTSGLTTCGRCGQQAQFCDATCIWVPMGACLSETGTCTPGMQTSGTGCPAGQSRIRTCNATCTYDDGPCTSTECTAGMTMMVACGRCGQRTRTCDATGHWVDGACAGEGPCMPGAMMTGTCETCGTQTSTCSTMCTWQAGACAGGVTCPTRPVTSCVDPMTLRVYDAPAACVSGACTYAPRNINCAAGCMANACVGGATLVTGLGGMTGYGPTQLATSDDGSSTAISLTPLSATGLNYYGVTHTTLFVNNNGNLTFGAASGRYQPPADHPMIAPFLADVDTRTAGQPAHNVVAWFIDGTRFVATWYLVGRYNMDNTTENSFQLIVTPRPARAAGDFDVEIRYAQCQWWMTGTGQAWAGFDSDDGRTVPLPGVQSIAMLDLCTTSNAGSPGIWRYEVRGGIPMLP